MAVKRVQEPDYPTNIGEVHNLDAFKDFVDQGFEDFDGSTPSYFASMYRTTLSGWDNGSCTRYRRLRFTEAAQLLLRSQSFNLQLRTCGKPLSMLLTMRRICRLFNLRRNSPLLNV